MGNRTRIEEGGAKHKAENLTAMSPDAPEPIQKLAYGRPYVTVSLVLPPPRPEPPVALLDRTVVIDWPEGACV